MFLAFCSRFARVLLARCSRYARVAFLFGASNRCALLYVGPVFLSGCFGGFWERVFLLFFGEGVFLLVSEVVFSGKGVFLWTRLGTPGGGGVFDGCEILSKMNDLPITRCTFMTRFSIRCSQVGDFPN